MSYEIGDKPRLTVVFRDFTRTLVDPTSVRFRFKTPDETETTYVYGVDSQVVRESVGVYHIDLPLNASDEWWYRWEGVGDVAGAIEKSFQVDATEFDSV